MHHPCRLSPVIALDFEGLVVGCAGLPRHSIPNFLMAIAAYEAAVAAQAKGEDHFAPMRAGCEEELGRVIRRALAERISKIGALSATRWYSPYSIHGRGQGSMTSFWRFLRDKRNQNFVP